MKKFIYTIIIFSLILISPNVYAASISVDSKCEETETTIDCDIMIYSKEKISGVSFRYDFLKNNFNQFTASDIWDLNKSNENGVFLVTKKVFDSSTSTYNVGKLILNKENLEEAYIKDIDIVYECKNDSYCDYMPSKIALYSTKNDDEATANNKEVEFDFMDMIQHPDKLISYLQNKGYLIYVIGGAGALLLLIILRVVIKIKRKKRRSNQ